MCAQTFRNPRLTKFRNLKQFQSQYRRSLMNLPMKKQCEILSTPTQTTIRKAKKRRKRKSPQISLFATKVNQRVPTPPLSKLLYLHLSPSTYFTCSQRSNRSRTWLGFRSFPRPHLNSALIRKIKMLSLPTQVHLTGWAKMEKCRKSKKPKGPTWMQPQGLEKLSQTEGWIEHKIRGRNIRLEPNWWSLNSCQSSS